MKRLTCVWFLSALLLAARSAPGQAVELVLPRGKLLTDQDSLIVTRTAPRGKKLSWSVEQGGVRERAVVEKGCEGCHQIR